jgi:hypothetical protein
MQMSRLALALAVAGAATHTTTAEQQIAEASVHIKISSGNQLRGAEHTKHDVFDDGEQTCKVMNWYNWSDFKYACQWNHGVNGYNIFFKRNDNTFVYECSCDNGLGSYDPWDLSVWTWSKGDGVACYSRDGRGYEEVGKEFWGVDCSARNIKNCDTAKGTCEKFPTGGDLPDSDRRPRGGY